MNCCVSCVSEFRTVATFKLKYLLYKYTSHTTSYVIVDIYAKWV